MSTVNLSNSRKGRISLMLLAFVFVAIQWYLIIGIFDFMNPGKLIPSGALIPNLTADIFGRPLVDRLVWFLYSRFGVLVPLYFWIRGKNTLDTKGFSTIAFGANVTTIIAWFLLEGGHIAITSGIMIMIMTAFLNTILAGALFVLLIYKLFPD